MLVNVPCQALRVVQNVHIVETTDASFRHNTCRTSLSSVDTHHTSHCKLILALLHAHNTQAKIVLNTVVCMFSEYCEKPFTVEPVDVVGPSGDVVSYPVRP